MNDRTNEEGRPPRISRRSAVCSVGFTALTAGLLTMSAPTAAAAGTSAPVVVVTGYGLSEVTRSEKAASDAAEAEAQAAITALSVALNAEQRRQLNEVVELLNEAAATYAQMQVSELARHIPGLAPVLPIVWTHIIEQRIDDIGVCCDSAETQLTV